MRSRHAQTVSALLLLLAVGGAASGPASPEKKILLGYALTHTEVHCPGAESGSARKESGVDAAHNVLLHYDEPQIRGKAQKILSGMKSEGADLVRTDIWFRDMKPGYKPSSADVLGLLQANAGSLRPHDVGNLVNYTSDVRAAGYDAVVFVLGPQVESNPKCRAVQWGACFDATTIPLSWSVIAQVKRAVQPFVRTGFRVILDIAPEMCGPAPPLAAANENEYMRFMIQHYVRTFPDHEFIASCGGGGSAQAGLRGIHQLVDAYQQLGTRPAGLDLHMYFANPADYGDALAGSEDEARRLDTDFYVLETYVGNTAVFEQLRTLLMAGKLPRFRGLALWPLRRSLNCQMSEAAPFPIGDAFRAVQGSQ